MKLKPHLPKYRQKGIHYFFDTEDGLDLTKSLKRYDDILTFKNVIGKYWYYFKYKIYRVCYERRKYIYKTGS